MEKHETNKYLNKFNKKIIFFKEIIDIEKIKEEINLLEKEMLKESFWNDSFRVRTITSKLTSLKSRYKIILNIESESKTIEELIELKDDGLIAEIEELIFDLDKKIADMELNMLLSEKYDSNNAILEIHPGAGGTESQDWAHMLYNMYLKYANNKDFKVEVLNYINGEEAGLKSVSLLIKGENAYGYLKSEVGVHRLVRISPFDASSRRHTSFASVDVIPEIDAETNILVNDDELKIDTYKASGAGGQHVNTTDSAVRITHIPTNIVICCQSERSQIFNRKRALTLLKAKLFKLSEEKKEKELKTISGDKLGIGFGSQIRSYILHPYSLVKDHRSNYEISNPVKILSGYLDDFIIEYLKYRVGNND